MPIANWLLFLFDYEQVEDAFEAWRNETRARATLDCWAHIAQQHDYPPEAAPQVGPDLVERLAQVLAFILGHENSDDLKEQQKVQRQLFLIKDQAYGLEDDQRQGRLSLRLVSTTHEVELFLQRLAQVDLELVRDRFHFDGLVLRALGRPLTERERQDLTKAVRDDLSCSGDPLEVRTELHGSELWLWVRELEWNEYEE